MFHGPFCSYHFIYLLFVQHSDEAYCSIVAMFYAVVSSNENLCIYCFFQIYIATTKLDHFSLIIFVFVIANLPKLIYMKSVGMK